MSKSEYFYGDEVYLDLEDFELTHIIFDCNNVRLFVNWSMYKPPIFIGTKDDSDNYYFDTLCKALKWAEKNQEVNIK